MLLFLKGLDLIGGDFEISFPPCVPPKARLEAEMGQEFLFFW
jgi:hypothetical protein